MKYLLIFMIAICVWKTHKAGADDKTEVTSDQIKLLYEQAEQDHQNIETTSFVDMIQRSRFWKAECYVRKTSFGLFSEKYNVIGEYLIDSETIDDDDIQNSDLKDLIFKRVRSGELIHIPVKGSIPRYFSLRGYQSEDGIYEMISYSSAWGFKYSELRQRYCRFLSVEVDSEV